MSSRISVSYNAPIDTFERPARADQAATMRRSTVNPVDRQDATRGTSSAKWFSTCEPVNPVDWPGSTINQSSGQSKTTGLGQSKMTGLGQSKTTCFSLSKTTGLGH